MRLAVVVKCIECNYCYTENICCKNKFQHKKLVKFEFIASIINEEFHSKINNIVENITHMVLRILSFLVNTFHRTKHSFRNISVYSNVT